jgi:arginase
MGRHRPMTLDRDLAVLDAPTNLGLRPPRPDAEPGVRGLAAAMRGDDLVRRVGADDAGAVAVPPYGDVADEATGFRNGPAIAGFTRTLASRVGELLDDGAFPVVLGGDCSVLLGAMLALRRRGITALAAVDGHDDFSLPRDQAAYRGRFAAAGLDLWLVTGHGSPILSDIEGLRPYVEEPRVVQIGMMREPGDDRDYATETFDDSDIVCHRAEDIRRDGGGTVGRAARSYLESAGAETYWVHVDVDVLHERYMPAVDSPNPLGITPDELTSILSELVSSRQCAGLDVAIYDPERDPDGGAGRLLADLLVGVLAPAGP